MVSSPRSGLAAKIASDSCQEREDLASTTGDCGLVNWDDLVVCAGTTRVQQPAAIGEMSCNIISHTVL